MHFRWQIFLKRLLQTIIISFCSYILIFGNYGLIDYVKYKKEIKIFKAQELELSLQKAQLLKNVQALSNEDIDIDLLELQLRKILAYCDKNETIYFWK
jgi:cell division protein FtsB